MSYKTEIKVYLPVKLVGELERYKRTGTRSKFVENAIRMKLDGIEGHKLDDTTLLAHMCWIRDKANLGPFEKVFMQSIIDKELEKK